MKLLPSPDCPPCARLNEILELRRDVLGLSRQLFDLDRPMVRIPYLGKVGRDKWTTKIEPRS